MAVRAPRRAYRSLTGLAPRKGRPGHERPLAAPSSAARHDRPCATPQAPGHDVPLATAAGAPGHGRPCAAQLVPDHYWSTRAYGAAASRTGARRHVCAYRRRSVAGPREPAAPDTSHCHSPHPYLPAIPPIRPEKPRRVLHAATYPQSRRNAAHPPCELPSTHLPALPLHYPSSASCHPGSAPPAVLLHCVYGLPPPALLRAPPPPVHRNPSLSADVLPLSKWWRGGRRVRPAACPAALDPLTRPHPVWPGSPPARRGFRARRCRRGPPPGRWRGSRGA